MARLRSRLFARLDWHRAQPAHVAPARLQRLSTTGPHQDGDPGSEHASHLILGDNLPVMEALLQEYEGRISLIYADPPFFSGKSYPARIGRGEDSRHPHTWKMAAGYDDSWLQGADYLDMLLSRLERMHRLLSPTGTLYLHLDWHASAYGRLLLDEVFGPDRFLNEIVWIYHGPSPIRSAFKRKHDTILVYTKSDRYTFNADAVRLPYDPATVRTFAGSPRAGFGKTPDLARGKVPEDWWYFPVVARLHRERTGFPTQKPEALLRRIVLASSSPGDWVADFFCGSGTLPVVASSLGRPWLACDRSSLAILTTYRRLLLSEGNRSRVDLWSAEGSATPGRLRVHCLREASRWEARLMSVESGMPFPDGVEVWEVDWDHDGQLFRSRAQAVRPWRSRTINLALGIPGPIGLVAARAFDTQGRMYFGLASS